MRTQGTYYIRGTEGRKDGRKDGRTEGRNAENYVPPLFFEKAGDNKHCRYPMSTSENVQIHVAFGYIKNFYLKIDLIARCQITNDVFDEILSHSSNGEMFT